MTAPFRVFDPALGDRTLTAADIEALVLALTQGSIDGMPIGATTPSTVKGTTITATGLVTLGSVGDALTAAGTTNADALVLTHQTNHVTTAGLGTGVVLPAAVVGQPIIVFNDGANPIKVYGHGTDTVDGAAAATGVTLTNAKRAIYLPTAAGAYISAQLGAVSA